MSFSLLCQIEQSQTRCLLNTSFSNSDAVLCKSAAQRYKLLVRSEVALNFSLSLIKITRTHDKRCLRITINVFRLVVVYKIFNTLELAYLGYHVPVDSMNCKRKNRIGWIMYTKITQKQKLRSRVYLFTRSV